MVWRKKVDQSSTFLVVVVAVVVVTNLYLSFIFYRGEKVNEAAKTNNNSGLRIIDELEEWITEQSRNTKTNNVSTSHDSLISSSSGLTGMGWDDSYDMVPGGPGQIDHVNGTHV